MKNRGCIFRNNICIIFHFSRKEQKHNNDSSFFISKKDEYHSVKALFIKKLLKIAEKILKYENNDTFIWRYYGLTTENNKPIMINRSCIL